jgi:hypothetical protein
MRQAQAASSHTCPTTHPTSHHRTNSPTSTAQKCADGQTEAMKTIYKIAILLNCYVWWHLWAGLIWGCCGGRGQGDLGDRLHRVSARSRWFDPVCSQSASGWHRLCHADASRPTVLAKHDAIPPVSQRPVRCALGVDRGPVSPLHRGGTTGRLAPGGVRRTGAISHPAGFQAPTDRGRVTLCRFLRTSRPSRPRCSRCRSPPSSWTFAARQRTRWDVQGASVDTTPVPQGIKARSWLVACEADSRIRHVSIFRECRCTATDPSRRCRS